VFRLTIAIGQFEHRSEDNGHSWTRTIREVPPKVSPRAFGGFEPVRLPSVSQGSAWDIVSMMPSGFCVAVGHKNLESDRKSAFVQISWDNGENWRPVIPGPPSKLLPRLGLTAAPREAEQIQSLVLVPPAGVLLAWDDPWLFDCPESHVLFSRDQGGTWDYHCLGQTNPCLGTDDHGRVFALNDGFFLETADVGQTWRKRGFELAWPSGYDQSRVALLRHVCYLDARIGYALVVHWPHRRGERPPDVGLVATVDGGARWEHVHVFDGPNIGDINERHMLGLRVD
jgi:hypothetical protein